MLTDACGRSAPPSAPIPPAGEARGTGGRDFSWSVRPRRSARLHGPFLGTRVRTDSTFAVCGIAVGLSTGQWWTTLAPRWWQDTSGVVVALGDLAALWGTLALLATVALTARVPWVEKAVGLDHMIRWHRRLAPWGLVLIVIHVGAAITAMALGEPRVLQVAWDMAVDLPDMLPAYAGLVLLLMVGVSSWRRVRTLMRYETWWVVHLYAYLGVGLSLLHELSLGNSLAAHPVARGTWLGVHVGVLALVLWYRITLPLIRSLYYGLRLEAVTPDGPRGLSVILTGRHLHRLPLVGGQFAQFRFCRRDLWWQAHPYSISGLPQEDTIRLTLATTGDYARAIATLAPGTRVLFEGPYGVCTAASLPPGHGAVLVAGGCGIAPMRSLLQDLTPESEPIVIYRVHSAEETMLGAEITAAAARLGGRAHILAGPRSVQPLDAQRLDELVPHIAQRHIFICGTPALSNAICAAARELGVPPTHIHAEDFAW